LNRVFALRATARGNQRKFSSLAENRRPTPSLAAGARFDAELIFPQRKKR